MCGEHAKEEKGGGVMQIEYTACGCGGQRDMTQTWKGGHRAPRLVIASLVFFSIIFKVLYYYFFNIEIRRLLK
jgi:hypothetical protein